MKPLSLLLLLAFCFALPRSAQTNESIGPSVRIHSNQDGQAEVTNHPIRLENVDLQQALDLYATIKSRTLLQHPGLKPARVTMVSDGKTKADIAKAFEDAFRDLDMIVIPDGEKFVMVVPTSATNSATPRSQKIAKREPVSSTNDELLPAGTIYLRGTMLPAVLEIYASVAGRKFAPVTIYPPGMIYLKNSIPLSKAEALYAFETLFGWNGFKIVPVGDDLLQIVALAPQ